RAAQVCRLARPEIAPPIRALPAAPSERESMSSSLKPLCVIRCFLLRAKEGSPRNQLNLISRKRAGLDYRAVQNASHVHEERPLRYRVQRLTTVTGGN